MKIGLVIADDMEFAPLVKSAQKFCTQEFMLCGDKAIRFTLENGTEFVAVLCGTGKVNAAGATASIICKESPDCVVNFGLSGAISGVKKNDIVIGTKFIEHDFDLTPLGYEIGVKPQETYCYASDEKLYNLFMEKFDFLKPCVFVTGDMFVSSKEKKEFIINAFDGGCCDMESAAVASVCHKCGTPFVSFRKLSDDADESANEVYKESNSLQEQVLADMAISLFS